MTYGYHDVVANCPIIMTYYIGPKITDWQKQIIFGTVLGGSSIVKPKGGRNSYLSMRGKDAYWMEYKSQELHNLASPTPFLIENENKYFRWHSLCYPEFNEYHDLFYADGKKKVEMEILNQLRDIGLAIWFLEGGKVEKNTVVFNTNAFRQEGTELICRYFNEIDIKAKPQFKKTSCRVVLVPVASKRFVQVIGHRVPAFMVHRLTGIKV